jgi:uncharacterized protein YidB (DUF937 family)
MRRHKSSSSPSQPNQPNIFQEKTERATQLHHELEDLMQNHHKRLKEESSRPVYAGFFSFMKRNKGEMINIGAAFLCTMLAYQIVGLRKYSQRLERELKEQKDAVDEKQRLLHSLSSAEFVQSTAQNCQQAMQDSGVSSKSSSWFGTKQEDSDATLVDTISQVLSRALRARIGDAGLSEEQKRDAIMTKLQQAQEELLLASAKQQKQEEAELMSLMGLGSNESEVVQDSESGETIVKKRRFAM